MKQPSQFICFNQDTYQTASSTLMLYTDYTTGNKDTHGLNSKRLADVWMDGYKRLFYKHRRDLIVSFTKLLLEIYFSLEFY